MGARGFSVQSGLSSSRSVPVSTAAVCLGPGRRRVRTAGAPSIPWLGTVSEWEGPPLVRPPPRLGSLPPVPPPPPWGEDSQHGPWLAGRWSPGASLHRPAPALTRLHSGGGAAGPGPGALGRGSPRVSRVSWRTQQDTQRRERSPCSYPSPGPPVFPGADLGGLLSWGSPSEPLGQSRVKSGPCVEIPPSASWTRGRPGSLLGEGGEAGQPHCLQPRLGVSTRTQGASGVEQAAGP